MVINDSTPPNPSPLSAPLDRPASNASGSSFKPLQLSSHPWVRAHLRPAPNNGQKPRLSFLALHYHMHGRQSFSVPREDTSTSLPQNSGVRSARHRNSPEALSEALGLGSPSLSSENVSAGGNTQTSYIEASKPSGYFSYKTAETSTSMERDQLHPTFERRSQSDIGPKMGASLPKPDTSRSISVPELKVPPVAMTYARSPDPMSHRHVTRHRTCAGESSAPPLAIAAFPDAFTGVLTTSEGVFGGPEQVLNPERQKKATAKWLRRSRKRKHDAVKRASLDNED